MIHLTLTWPMLWRAVGHLVVAAAELLLLDFYFEARCEMGSRGKHWTFWSVVTSLAALFLISLAVDINGSF